MSTDEIQSQVIDSYLQKIALALGLPTAPDFLTNEQIAGIAKLKDAHTLSSSVERGIRTGDKRWIAYRAVIRKGAHRVPATDVARWMSIAAGKIATPRAADHAHTLASVWGHRCLGGG
jgi:hypothetical protein